MLLDTLLILVPIVAAVAFTLASCGGGAKEKKTTTPNSAASTDKNATANTNDPNYQTMAGVGGECFGKDKAAPGAAGAPAAGAPAAGAAAPKPDAPKAPVGAGNAVAATHDPNYQTLAGIGGDCFAKDKKK